MLSWLKSLFWRPSAHKEDPSPPKPKPILLAQGRHSLSPYRLLEWYAAQVDRQLDPLPPYPKGEALPRLYPESPRPLKALYPSKP